MLQATQTHVLTSRRRHPRTPTSPSCSTSCAKPCRSRHYSRRTEQTYCHWVKRYVHFHNLRHPVEMAEPEINAFLTHLAVKEKVAASTQNQALSGLLFLYRHVLGREVGDLGEVIRARKPKRLPVVMTRDEVKAVLANLGYETLDQTGRRPNQRVQATLHSAPDLQRWPGDKNDRY